MKKEVRKRTSARRAGRKATAMIQRMLVPIDFSASSRNALAYAVPLAQHFGAEIILVHVVEPTIYPADFSVTQVGFPNIDEELRLQGQTELAALAESIPENVKSSTVIRSGKAFLEITRLAREKNVDIIIIASHGHTGVENIFFGSTAEKVVRKAHCPVLVLKESGEASRK